jgi:hypothetical protein
MARLPFRSFPKAVEFSIETLFNQVGSTGFFCISPSTWELAYSLILGYGYWRSRYYFRDAITGELQDITDEEYTEITNIVDIAVEEFQMAGCEDLTDAVNNLTAQVGLINTNVANANDCGCDGTSFDESELTDEDVQEPGPDYLDDKCRVANVLHDRIRNFASTMDTIGVDNILNLGVGLATSIVAGLVLAGPGGWATLLVIGVVSGILLLLVDLTAGQFGDLVTELDNNQDDLVCALFSATDASGARDAYVGILDAQAVGVPVQQVVAFMLTNSVTNQLFVPSGAYISGTDWLNDGYTPTDCDTCGTDSLSYIVIDGIECGTGSLQVSATQRTLQPTYFEAEDIYRLQFQMNDQSRNVGMNLVVVSDAGVTGWPTCRVRCNSDQETIWIHDDATDGLGPAAEEGNFFKGGNFKINSLGASFSIQCTFGPFDDDCV